VDRPAWRLSLGSRRARRAAAYLLIRMAGRTRLPRGLGQVQGSGSGTGTGTGVPDRAPNRIGPISTSIPIPTCRPPHPGRPSASQGLRAGARRSACD